MSHESEFEYFEKMAHWSFDEFGIHEECLTDWDLYGLLKKYATADSRILDLGTAGGEKILEFFPDCAEILGTDYSPAMIDTACKNPSHMSRLPGCIRKETGRWQQLLYLNPGAGVDQLYYDTD